MKSYSQTSPSLNQLLNDHFRPLFGQAAMCSRTPDTLRERSLDAHADPACAVLASQIDRDLPVEGMHWF